MSGSLGDAPNTAEEWMRQVNKDSALQQRRPNFQPTITELAADTGWIDAVLNTGSGWTALAGEPPQYRRRGGIVYMRGRASSTGALAAAFTLPAGFVPVGLIVWIGDAAGAARGLVTPSTGTVGLASAAAATNFAFGSCPPFLVD